MNPKKNPAEKRMIELHTFADLPIVLSHVQFLRLAKRVVGG
jgi:hypothetical protein